MEYAFEYVKPMEIEARSFAIIETHLQNVTLPEPERQVLKRVIHTTADFDYVENLKFSDTAVKTALDALQIPIWCCLEFIKHRCIS